MNAYNESKVFYIFISIKAQFLSSIENIYIFYKRILSDCGKLSIHRMEREL